MHLAEHFTDLIEEFRRPPLSLATTKQDISASWRQVQET